MADEGVAKFSVFTREQMVAADEWLNEWVPDVWDASDLHAPLTRLIAEAEARGAERMREAAAKAATEIAHAYAGHSDARGALLGLATSIRRLKVTP